jgi:hypothetical protein
MRKFGVEETERACTFSGPSSSERAHQQLRAEATAEEEMLMLPHNQNIS